jgi:hypothetical protein
MVTRMSYFDRQFLRHSDLALDQGYHSGHARSALRALFRPGIAAGLELGLPAPDRLVVSPGWAVDPLGRQIVLEAERELPLATAEGAVWIAYGEAPSDPVALLGAEELRFRHVEETPAITVAPIGAGPENALLLGVLGTGGTIDLSGRPATGPTDGSVSEAALADGAVTTAKLADGAVTEPKLADGAVSEAKIADGAVSEAKIADGTVSTAKLGQAAVVSDRIGAAAIASTHLAAADGSSAQNLDAGAGVKTGHLQDGAVTLAKTALSKLRSFTVDVPAAAAGVAGTAQVQFDEVPSEQPAYYLISVDAGGNTKQVAWQRVFARTGDQTTHLIRAFNEGTAVAKMIVFVQRLL